MKVVFKGSDPLLLSTYNGKKYAFYRNQVVDIPPEVYSYIVKSGHVSATYLVPVEAPIDDADKDVVVLKEELKALRAVNSDLESTTKKLMAENKELKQEIKKLKKDK